MFNRKKIPGLLMFVLLALILVSCNRAPKEPVSKSKFLLNTMVTITLYDQKKEALIDEAFRICEEYENLLSRTITTSTISKMNQRSAAEQSFSLTPELEELFSKALNYSALSDGAFDITIEPVSSLWDFTGSAPSVPAKDQIESLLPTINYHNIDLANGQITFLSPDTKVDLGGIAKGFIADKIKAYLLDQGVKSAIINLGGNVLCIGSKPDGTPFKIGVQMPFEDRNETAAVMNIRDLSVVSSGIYERHFIVNGVNYHHILDPDTGYPYDNNLLSVTIISPHSIDGDGLSTTCFGLGLEKGIELIDSLPDIYAVFITDDGVLHYSEGAKDLITTD